MATLTATQKSSKSKPFTCRFISIVVEINDYRYDVDKIDAGEFGTVAFRLTKRSGDHKTYDVIRNHFGIVACDCPDYVSRHDGNGYGMCKHGRMLVELGLMAAPIAPNVTRPAPRAEEQAPVAKGTSSICPPTPCCSPTELVPCMACVPAVVAPDPATAILAAGIALVEVEVVEPVPVEDLCAECQLPTLDDSEKATIARCICPGCRGDVPDDEPFAPTEQDEAEYRRYCHEQAAREHLDVFPSLPLAEALDHVTDFFTAFRNPFGELLSGVMAKLALQCRLSECFDPTQLAVKIDHLEADMRDQYIGIGYEEGKLSAAIAQKKLDLDGPAAVQARRGKPSSGAAYGSFPAMQAGR